MNLPPTSLRRRPSVDRAFLAVTTLTMLAATACAPKSATTPAPAAAPPAPATPTIMQTCPEPSDGPSIVVNAVEEAHRALLSNPATALPPGCVLAAFARIPGTMPDSIDAHALAIAAELAKRGGNQRDVLASQVVLYARAHRYADVSSTYGRLAAIDPQPPIDVAQLAIAAVRQRGDTAALLRLVSKTAARADAPPALRTESNILKQVGALRSAVNEARGLVRQNPKYVAAYPSLIANFGTLGMTDSVVAYVRRALANGATRASLTTSVDPLVNAMLRHAALYGSTYGWDAQIASAMRVDSVISTPSTKFLVASLIAQAAEPRITEITAQVKGVSWLPKGSAAADASQDRARGCRQIASVVTSLDAAEAKMRAGGAGYAGGGATQMAASIAAERGQLAMLQDLCGQPDPRSLVL